MAQGIFSATTKKLLDDLEAQKKTIETDIKYEGYIKKELMAIEKAEKLKVKTLPTDTDYMKIEAILNVMKAAIQASTIV